MLAMVASGVAGALPGNVLGVQMIGHLFFQFDLGSRNRLQVG